MLAWVVDMASRVVTPSATRAGTALWSSQNESQDTETVIQQSQLNIYLLLDLLDFVSLDINVVFIKIFRIVFEPR